MSMQWSKCNVDHWTHQLKQSHLFLSLKERDTNWEQNLMRTWSCSHSHEGCKNMDGASFGCLHQLPAMVDHCTGHSWQPALKGNHHLKGNQWNHHTSNVRGEQCFNASFFSFGRKKRQFGYGLHAKCHMDATRLAYALVSRWTLLIGCMRRGSVGREPKRAFRRTDRPFTSM